MTIAAYNPPPGGALGLTPVLQKVVGIRLNTANVPGLNWAIFGKVVVTNPNPNPENVVAELVAPAVSDTTNVTIPAKSSQSISLEGVLAPPAGVPPPCVEIKGSSTLSATQSLPDSSLFRSTPSKSHRAAKSGFGAQAL